MPRRSGGEFVVEYLIKEGVPYVVGLPGHGTLAFLDAMRKSRERLKLIMVRHEQSAAHVADAASHFQLVQLPGLFVFGVIAAVVFQRTGRLGTAIWTHVGFNATTVVLLLT